MTLKSIVMELYKSVVCPPWEETGVTLVIPALKICTRFRTELAQAVGMTVGVEWHWREVMEIDWSGVCWPGRKAAVKGRLQSLCLAVLCSPADSAGRERKARVSSWRKNPSRTLKEQVAASASGHDKALSSNRAQQGVCFPFTDIALQFTAGKALSLMNLPSDLIQPSYTSGKELLFCRCSSHLNESFSSKD